MERNGIERNRRASDAGRRREAPGTRRKRRGFSVDARGCFEVILGYGYGSLLCSGGDHWVVLGG